jgi:hypothetical protein
MSPVTGWRADLAAARRPPTPEQDVWDRHWRGRYDRYVAGGKTPNAALPIASRLTEDQYGQRPEINTTEET